MTDSSSEEYICPHVDYVDTLKSGRKILKPSSWHCQHGKCSEPNSLFACLTCGHISCADDSYSGHAEDHCQQKRRNKHSIAMDINSHRIYCFLCEREGAEFVFLVISIVLSLWLCLHGTSTVHNDTRSNSIQVFMLSVSNLL